MMMKKLGGLCLRLWSAAAAEDIALIFADPTRGVETLTNTKHCMIKVQFSEKGMNVI
jgi:hypothetical protein